MSKTEYNRRLARKLKEEGRCPHCGGDRDDQFITCSKCRKKGKVSSKRLQKEREEQGLCRLCGDPLVDVGYKTCVKCNKKSYDQQTNSENIQKSKKAYYQNIKDAAFNAYGGYACVCCGENEPLFMCIDHVEGGGEQHRQNEVGRGRNIYSWLKKNDYPAGFQVLCQNCNIGKHLNGGVCPHKTRGT